MCDICSLSEEEGCWQTHLRGSSGCKGHDWDSRKLLPNHAKPPVCWPEVMAPVGINTALALASNLILR